MGKIKKIAFYNHVKGRERRERKNYPNFNFQEIFFTNYLIEYSFDLLLLVVLNHYEHIHQPFYDYGISCENLLNPKR